MGSPMLHIQNMNAWYGRKMPWSDADLQDTCPIGKLKQNGRSRNVLSNFSIELQEHEIVGLIGLNGAGKTTFLKTLSGLLQTFCADEIRFHGKNMKFRDNAFKTCRYTVFAEDNSFQYFTFWEYLSYVSAAYHQKMADTTALIQGFHFEEYTDVLLRDLSTGNRKKVFLITAFALKPDLLLLDEPVNGLDFQSTEFLYQQIAGYKAYGTVLFSSHVLESITLTSDRVLVLEEGRIRQAFEGSGISTTGIREALQYEDHV